MLDNERSVVVATFANEIDAQIAHDFLDDHGIRSYISFDDSGGMEPYLQLTRGVRLIILERDAEAAVKALQALENGAAEEMGESSS